MLHLRIALTRLSTVLTCAIGHTTEDHHLAEDLQGAYAQALDLSERLEEDTLEEAALLADRIVVDFAGWAQHHQVFAGHCETSTSFAMHLQHVVTEAGEIRLLVLEAKTRVTLEVTELGRRSPGRCSLSRTAPDRHINP